MLVIPGADSCARYERAARNPREIFSGTQGKTGFPRKHAGMTNLGLLIAL